MISLGVYIIKAMQQKDMSATSGEDSKPQRPPAGKKKKTRKQNRHRAKSVTTVEMEKSDSSDDDQPPDTYILMQDVTILFLSQWLHMLLSFIVML